MGNAIHCPECGRIMSDYGPGYNDSEGPSAKIVKLKCENCSPHGGLWEARIVNGKVAEIKFLRALFRDHDHR